MRHWWFPESASSYGGDLDSLFYLILYITGAVFLGVEVGLVWFVIKYRRRPVAAGEVEPKALYIEGSTAAEIIWTMVPAVLVVLIAVLSQGLWYHLKDGAPSNATPIGVMVKQFEWQFTMAGADGRLGTDDDITRKDHLTVQVEQAYQVELQSIDVIHSFFVPAFRLKQDAVPGMTTRAWFRATRVGEFEVACAELCGLGHYRMPARLVVLSAEDFARWQAAESPPPPPPPAGAGQ